jgi:hypothetical protein
MSEPNPPPSYTGTTKLQDGYYVLIGPVSTEDLAMDEARGCYCNAELQFVQIREGNLFRDDNPATGALPPHS